jgi:dephospho-CoA kinase
MIKKTTGVAFYGKVRIPTIGHKAAIDQAKDIATNTGGKLSIGLSGSAEPLDLKTKKAHAEKVFGHPVDTGTEHTRTLASFLSHLHKSHDHLHLVAGSDRVEEYKSFLQRYNGKKDKKGNVPFHFKSYTVHAAGGERKESNKDPRKMSRAELTSSVSASKLEKLAKDGNYDHFKAYHPDMPDSHVRKVFTQIRKHHSLNEEVTRKELAPMLDSFVSFASNKLGLKSMPNLRYKTDKDGYNSFAAYNPSSNELSVSTMNRHPMDIFRSVAHELVHHKQNEDGKLGKDIAKEGSTGSDIENEANSEAGKIMRWFAKSNPDMFKQGYVVEDHAANHASGGDIRGMGYVTGQVSPTVVSNYLTQNIADTKKMQSSNKTQVLDTGEGDWKDEEGANEYKQKNLQEGINDPGKLKAIFLAGGPGSGKDFVMNSVLRGEGLREVNSDVAFEYLMQKNGLDLEMPDEERVERDIVRGRAKNITKEQERLALAGRLGLIINGTADDLEKIKTIKRNLEADGYETMMVFVNTSNDVSRERNVERGKLGKRKVPDGTNKQGMPDGTENIRQEKWDLAQKNIGELQKIFGNKNFSVVDNTADVRKVSPEQKEKIQTNFNRVRRMAQQFVRADNQNPAAKVWIEKEAQKRGITYQEPRATKTLTQVRQSVPNVVHKPDNELMAQARKLGLSYYGFGRFGRKVGNENKVLYHSKGGKLVKVQPMNEEKKMKNDPCWKGYEMIGKKKKNGKQVPNCVPVEEGRESINMKTAYKVHNRIPKVIKRKLAETIDTSFEKYMIDPANREVGTNSVVQIYKSMTPGQNCVSESKKVKIVRKKLTREDNNIPRGGLPIGNGLGQELNVSKAPGFYMGFSNVGNSVYEASQSIQEWALSPKTQQKFAEKYGNLAEEKLIEAALKLESCGCGSMSSKPTSVKRIKEMAFAAASSGKDPTEREGEKSGSVPVQVAEDQLNERGADSRGYYRSTESGAGLTPAGAKKFGVKTAVTTPPSKLKKGSKAAKRRKSFCARMGGMPGPMKDEKGRPTRKAMSLRRWNCEE